jgi:hypothetical protein
MNKEEDQASPLWRQGEAFLMPESTP